MEREKEDFGVTSMLPEPHKQLALFLLIYYSFLNLIFETSSQ